MKGLYISNIDPKKSVGYMPKILGQIQGFSQLGYDMELVCFNELSQVILLDFSQNIEHFSISQILSQANTNLMVRRISLLRAAIKHIAQTMPDFIYLRYPRSEPLYLVFLARIRQKFPKLTILSEFPTFPYDQEYKESCSHKDQIVFLLDKITRHYLKYFVDRVVAINYAHPIFGIETISIDNGIDVQNYTSIDYFPGALDSINLIGVANVSPWHGYDRVIKGLGEYYRKSDNFLKVQKVIFHIIGAQGAYLNNLLTLVQKEEVTDAVIFHQPTQGKELDNLFTDCHLAIGVLGGHRKGLEVMSPLKNREYCARGIPFIFSHIDPDFSDRFEYCLQLRSNETPIDIRNLIEFISELKDKHNVVSSMRHYAQETLDWSIKLRPVKAYIDEKLC